MLEAFLEKYDERYKITSYSIVYKSDILEVGFKNSALAYFTSVLNPKPFLDGAVVGSIFGLGVSIFSGENYLIDTFCAGVGFGAINQQQDYFMLFMDYSFDIFQKRK